MKHKLTPMALSLFMAGSASAETDAQWRERMEQRMGQLEQLVKTQQAALAERDRQIEALKAPTAANTSKGWFQKVEVGGTIEVEANHSRADGAPDTSDIAVSTVELGLNAQIHDWVGSEIVLLYEDTGNSNGQINVDTAVIQLADPNASWAVTAGQFTLPFGTYNSHMVSDPLTLDLGETSDAALSATTQLGAFNAAVFLFEGDQGNNQIDNWGMAAGFETTQQGVALQVQAGFLNDIAESDAIVDDGTAMTNKAPAYTVSTQITAGAFNLIGEYLAATRALSAYAGDRPSAFTIETAYSFTAGRMPATVALGFQGTRDAANTAGGMPESRWLGSLALEVAENTTFAVEYLRAQDYAGANTDTLTGQLAISF